MHESAVEYYEVHTFLKKKNLVLVHCLHIIPRIWLQKLWLVKNFLETASAFNDSLYN